MDCIFGHPYFFVANFYHMLFKLIVIWIHRRARPAAGLPCGYAPTLPLCRATTVHYFPAGTAYAAL